MTRSVTAVVIQHFSSHTFFLHASIAYHARHSPALPHRASYLVLLVGRLQPAWGLASRRFFENFIGTGVHVCLKSHLSHINSMLSGRQMSTGVRELFD